MDAIKKVFTSNTGSSDSQDSSGNQQYSSQQANTGELRQQPGAGGNVYTYDKVGGTGALGGRDTGLAGAQPTGASDYSSGQALGGSSGPGTGSTQGAFAGGLGGASGYEQSGVINSGQGITGGLGGHGIGSGAYGSGGHQEAGYPGSGAAGYGGGGQGYNETGTSYASYGRNNAREGGVLDKVKGTAKTVWGRGHNNDDFS